MAKGIEKGTVERKPRDESKILGIAKQQPIDEIAMVLLADGTPTAKVAFLTGMTEIEIKRLIECK